MVRTDWDIGLGSREDVKNGAAGQENTELMSRNRTRVIMAVVRNIALDASAISIFFSSSSIPWRPEQSHKEIHFKTDLRIDKMYPYLL